MRFDFADEQEHIRETAREFLAERFPPERVREHAEAGSYDKDAWSEICELGWPGIAIPEAYEGQGLGVVELVILCEQLGYACAPTPLLSNAAAGLAITAAGSDSQRERWLAGIASGEALGTVGVTPAGTASASGSDRSGAASGSKAAEAAPLVPDAAEAEVIVLLDADGARLLERSRAEVEPRETIDPTRRFARVTVSEGEQLPGDPSEAGDRIAVALAAELTGIAQRAMEMAVDYAKERKQFGRPIGAYQAVSHRCAGMLYATEEARSLTYYAAWAADADPESLPLAAAMAKARASDAAWSVTTDSLQVHGGIGFTWEHDLHFLIKRARVAGALYGTAAEHRDRVADLAGLRDVRAP
jgi:alkylation response protein AidB-like acyl-CoA dehydrogenase